MCNLRNCLRKYRYTSWFYLNRGENCAWCCVVRGGNRFQFARTRRLLILQLNKVVVHRISRRPPCTSNRKPRCDFGLSRCVHIITRLVHPRIYRVSRFSSSSFLFLPPSVLLLQLCAHPIAILFSWKADFVVKLNVFEHVFFTFFSRRDNRSWLSHVARWNLRDFSRGKMEREGVLKIS